MQLYNLVWPQSCSCLHWKKSGILKYASHEVVPFGNTPILFLSLLKEREGYLNVQVMQLYNLVWPQSCVCLHWKKRGILKCANHEVVQFGITAQNFFSLVSFFFLCRCLLKLSFWPMFQNLFVVIYAFWSALGSLPF